MSLIKFKINNKDYFINSDEWEKYNNFFKNKTLYNMTKFNPNSKQAIEIVRRLCDKYPELVSKSEEVIDKEEATDRIVAKPGIEYRMKISKLIDDCRVCTSIFVNDKDYKLHISSYTQGTLEINPKLNLVIPINKDEYDELATIFDYAIDRAIINSMIELGFTNNAIEEMFKDEEKTE